MIERFTGRTLLLILSLYLALPLCSAQPVDRAATLEQPTLPTASALLTNVFHPVSPGPIDGQIATATAYMLTNYHYVKKPFDAAVSSQFLDRYLETLDPQHLHFTQADLAEFEHYRTNLNRLTFPNRRPADTTPACEIFNRFVERLEQRTAYADDLLKQEKFTFDTDERITINRKELPYPANLDEAKKLWQQRLRFEYLQERLGKIGSRKKNLAAAAKIQPPLAETNALVKTTTVASPKKTDEQEIVDTLSHRYYRNLRFFTEWDNEDVLQVYLTALAHVYDPHSDYLDRRQLEQFAIGMNLSLFGVGAELQAEDGYCKIRRLLPGGPAIKSKQFKVNDRIVAVAQSNQTPVDIIEMSLPKAVQLIRGPKGTEVSLTIIPADADASTRKVVNLIRDEIALPEYAAKAKIIEAPDRRGGTLRLGVIDLPTFYATFETASTKDKPEPKSTTADVAKLLDKLKEENVAGVILDLRLNGGGSLEEAIRLTGLFIKTGPVVQVRDERNRIQTLDDDDPAVRYDGPLVVLTSRHSASASEILAGALQDYGRALIVGDSSTHGKGTVQSVNPLRNFIPPDSLQTNDPGALKLTIKKFFRPSGLSTQLKGVVSDIVLPSVANESKDIGESALENPLPCSTNPPAKYDHFNLVEPYLTELRARSAERVAADKEFAYVREDMELFKKRQADKTISLDEKQRLKEQDEAEARQKARDKDRLARPEPREKVYEITLKLADQPGLPPPVTKTNAALAKLLIHAGAIPSGVSTNSVAAAAPGENNPDEADAEKPTPPDEPLLEAEHILVDYLSVLPKGNLVTKAP